MSAFNTAKKNPVLDIDLMHPEILTTVQIRTLLLTRNVDVDLCLSREDLLELYGRTIQPLPQRTCLANRRGQLLLKNRQKQMNKRKIEAPSSGSSMKTLEPAKKTLRITSSSLPETKSPSVQDRLKPPPSPLANEKSWQPNGSEGSKFSKNTKFMKIINDTLTSNVTTNLNGDDGKLPTKNKSIEESGPPKKKHKQITWP